MKRSSTILATLVVICFAATAQTNTVRSRAPKVVLPSPHAASLGKYGDIPVSPYTGVPDINIPVYELKSGDITVPISLSYHASGIKVHEEASRVGLGWSINTGGIISRTIYGKDDFSISPEAWHKALTAPEFVEKANVKTGYSIIQGCSASELFPKNEDALRYLNDGVEWDFQPDHYSYNFLNYSGKFILRRDKSLVFNKPEKIKVEVLDEEAKKWKVTTDDGFVYKFDQFETYQFDDGGLSQEHKSSWYLTEIISPKGDVVTFSYKSETNFTKTVGSFYEEVIANSFGFIAKGNSFSNAGVDCSATAEPGATLPGKQYKTLLLEYIDSKEGRIQFNYSDRVDLQNDKRLTSIVLFKKNIPASEALVELRKWELTQDYFIGTGDPDYLPDVAATTHRSHRLRLTGFSEVSSNGRLKKPYRFVYYGDDMPSSQLPAKTSFARDHWGYFNGKFSNQSLIPAFVNANSQDIIRFYMGVMENNRDTDPAFAKTFSLKEMIYPTGGRTEFQYESHTYDIAKSRVNDKSFYGKIADIKNGNVNKLLAGDKKGVQSVSVDLSNIYVDPTAQTGRVKFRVFYRFKNQLKDCNITNGKVFFSITGANGDLQIETDLNGSSFTKCDGNVVPDRPDQSRTVGITYENSFNAKPGVYQFKLRIEYDPTKPFNPEQFQFDGQSIQDISVNADFIEPKKGLDFAGGLRIKSITDKDGTDVSKWTVKNYSYSGGKLMSKPQYTYFNKINKVLSSSATTQSASAACHQLIRSSDSHITLNGSASGSVVGYDEVTVLTGFSGEYGKTVYTYDNAPDVIYDYSVLDLLGIGDLQAEVVLPMKFPQIAGVPNLRNGLVRKQVDYAYQGPEKYSPVREITYDYIDGKVNPANTMVYGLEVRTPVGEFIDPGTCKMLTFIYPSFQFNWIYLSYVREVIFDNAKSRETITQNFYENPAHMQLTKKVVSVTNGRKDIELYRYPADYSDTESSEAITSMKGEAFMHGLLVEHRGLVERNNVGYVVESDVNHYSKFAGKIFKQSSAALKTTSPIKESDFDPYKPSSGIDSRYKFEEQYDYYDNGNLKSAEISGEYPILMQWGYNDRFTVAEIANAQLSEVYYTSFEESGTEDATGSKAGNRFHAGDFTFTPPAELQLRESLLSYWYYEDQEWHLKTVPYSGGTLTITDGERIDELRVYPKGAQVTTFTHEPMIGMSARSDINNQTLQYEYDGLGRLMLVRDRYRNIIKHYDYQYKNVK